LRLFSLMSLLTFWFNIQSLQSAKLKSFIGIVGYEERAGTIDCIWLLLRIGMLMYITENALCLLMWI
jgi:hypothetical protein